jgi:hypothetical protein
VGTAQVVAKRRWLVLSCGCERWELPQVAALRRTYPDVVNGRRIRGLGARLLCDACGRTARVEQEEWRWP